METNILITNAHVITMDSEQPFAEAVAIRGNKILAVGTNDDVLRCAGSSSICIDAQGNSVLPGFIDSHMHLFIGCAAMDNVKLGSVESVADLREALLNYRAIHPEQRWICGSHLRYIKNQNGSPITNQDLDEIIDDQPVVLMAYDYHTVWVNRKAMELAEVNEGDGTGILREPSQYGRVLAKTGIWGQTISPLTGVAADTPIQPQEMQKLIRKGMEITGRYGITSLHNMDGNIQILKMLLEAEACHELTARIHLSKSITAQSGIEALQEADEMKKEAYSAVVSGGSVKLFMDGVIESETASLLEPYATNSPNKGENLYSADHLRETIAACQRMNLQVIVHAIGDGAVRHTLNGFEQEPNHKGAFPFRHRIEHLELIHPDDIPRLKRLGVIASMQPYHVPLFGEGDPIWMEKVGEARIKNGFLWQSIRQAGAKLIFGSDWPVASADPIKAMQACLTRQPLSGDASSQRQNIHDIIRSYTVDAAYAEHRENDLGKIRAGYLADIVILSRDILIDPENTIGNTKVNMTIFDGRIVYEDG